MKIKKMLCILLFVSTIFCSTAFAAEADNSITPLGGCDNCNFVLKYSTSAGYEQQSASLHIHKYNCYYVCDGCGYYKQVPERVSESHTSKMSSAKCDKSRHTYYYNCNCGYYMGTTSVACPNPNGNCVMPLAIDL